MNPEADTPEPIIVVKKKGKHHGHHGGAWKVAYADFVTAMMAFFLVMWLVNQSDVVKESVGGYFRDPAGFADKAGSGVLNSGAALLSHPKPPANEEEEQERERKEKIAREQLEETGETIMETMEQLPGLLKVQDRVEVEMTNEGLRIQLMESGDSTFFDIGSAKLAPSGISVVSAIGDIIAPLDNEVIVEGHTDSRRYTRSDVYSNWELSSDRANTARRVLETRGIAPGRFAEIRAFADNQLRYPDNSEDARNRRIAIIIVNPFSQRGAIGPPTPLHDKIAEFHLR